MTRKPLTLTGLLSVAGLSWWASAATSGTAPAATMPGMVMPPVSGGMAMPPMPKAGAPFKRVPIDQLPEATITGPTRMGNLVMPPGMIMTGSTSMEAMKDMAAVDPTLVKVSASPSARGDQRLTPRLVSGVKEYRLTLGLSNWNILPTRQVVAYTVNGQVPGPRLRFQQGDRIRVVVKNTLPEATSIHWHGMILDNRMDGVGDVTQKPIAPGATFTYEFTAVQAGTYYYHSHTQSDRQQGLGLYGAIIIDPPTSAANIARVRALTKPGDAATAIAKLSDEPRADQEYVVQLQEWLWRDGYTFPAMIMEGALPNYFTINGKAYPSTDTIQMKVGQTVKLRFIGTNNNFVHPMHVHGGPFEVVARDGETLKPSARFLADTVNVGPGQRYDVIWKARKAGTWLLHCHIPHHTVNDNVEEQGGGGLMMKIVVKG